MSNEKQYKNRIQKNALVATLAYFYHGRIRPLQKGHRLQRYTGSRSAAGIWPRGVGKPRVAFICDDMTWANFSPLCEAVALDPSNWRSKMEKHRPEIFFCESAWTGIQGSPLGWRGKIYKNHKVLFENRRELLEILCYCRDHGIKTVFWNKEDPVYFGSDTYDFTDTALRFDYLFTTAQECVERYQALGHHHVDVLRFGFNPTLFNPLGKKQGNAAVFAGSWYADLPQRCEQMRQCFSILEEAQIPLTIYDRHSGGGAEDGRNRYPEEYQTMVRPAVEYARLGQVLKEYEYGVNINTVTASRTMFARRVFEMMACGLKIISNASEGMKELFPGRVWYLGEPQPDWSQGIVEENLRQVFLKHTMEVCFYDMLRSIGEPVPAGPKVLVLWKDVSQEQMESRSKELSYDRLEHVLWSDRKTAPSPADYGIILEADTPLPDLKFWLTQRAFLPKDCGICAGGPRFQIAQQRERTGVLLPWEQLHRYLDGIDEEIPVYHV